MKNRVRGVGNALLIVLCLSFFPACAGIEDARIKKTFLAATESEDFETDGERIRYQLSEYLDGLEGQGLFSGAVLYARDGEVRFQGAWGAADAERNISNGVYTKFLLGSVTKPLTAFGIMNLAGQGKIGLEDGISRYLSDCPEAWSDITIAQLLSHTSGIHDITNTIDFYVSMKNKKISPDALVGMIKKMPIDFSPGKKYAYCNAGYMLLGRIIETVSGKSYGRFMAEDVFTPLGMGSSGYAEETMQIDGLARGYDGRGREIGLKDLSLPFSAGGGYSTIGDMYRFSQALDGNAIVPREVLEAMFEPKIIMNASGTAYGYGWMLSEYGGRKIAFHDGGIDGFTSFFCRYPEENEILVVLCNKEEKAFGQVISNLNDIILRTANQ